MGKYGYDFYFNIGGEVLTLPITPSSLRMTIGSNNKVVTLIDEGDINILKSPSLAEFEFDARFPMRKYPYSRDALNFETYMNKFTALKTDKKPFVFNVIRTTPDGKGTWATVRRVTLEDLEINEDADEGDDVIVSFSLKEYKEYGVKTLKSPSSVPTTTSTSEQSRSTDNKASEPVTYTIKSGDCMWNIAKMFYGDGSKWTGIYEANKTVIENAAKKYGRSSSSNGHWIYPGTVLVIPEMEKVNNLVTSGTNNPQVNYTLTVNVKNPLLVGKYRVMSDGVLHGEYNNSSTYKIKQNVGVKVTTQPPTGYTARFYIIKGSSSYWSTSTNLATINKMTGDFSLQIEWVKNK